LIGGSTLFFVAIAAQPETLVFSMKTEQLNKQKPSSGTVIAEKYRARMNSCTDSQRQELMNQAMASIYSAHHASAKTNARRG